LLGLSSSFITHNNAAHKEHTYKVQQYKNITKKHETLRIEMFMKHEEEEITTIDVL